MASDAAPHLLPTTYFGEQPFVEISMKWAQLCAPGRIHHPSEMMYRRALDHFTCLYEESAEHAKIMAIACHPYLSGVPHRIRHVQHTFEEILSRDGVVAWDGSQILDWYLAQQRQRG